MKRRSFLRSAAAALPAASFSALSLAQSIAAQRHDAPHFVSSGQDRQGEAHSLGFSTILFKVLPRETSGNLFVIEHKDLGHGGPPVHLHLHQEEWFYVMEGEVLFQVGDTRHTLRAGESLLGPRGVPHGFAGVGENLAHMIIAFSPAGKMEAFFREAAVPNGPKMDAALFARFDMQYVGPPLVVS
ncbi:MAG: cupin domain-containing protein [Acidobacteriaceae bacterium]|jgi:quercetin dioxygenase-like cupin family protein